MPQFNPPNLERRKSPGEALLGPVSEAIANAPNNVLAYKQYHLQKMKHDLEMQEISAKIAELRRKVGGIGMTSELPGMIQTQIEQKNMPYYESTLSPEQEIERVGTDSYEAQTKRIQALKEPQYMLLQVDKNMNPINSIQLPPGMRLGQILKPQEEKPMPGTAGLNKKFEEDFGKAYNFLFKIKYNKETLEKDMMNQERKLTVGIEHPTAGQGYIGKISRALQKNSPEQAVFATNVGKTIDLYRKDITGAQAGFPELNRLEARLPTTEEPENSFISKSNDTMVQGISIMKKELERARKKGIDTSVYEQQLNDLEKSVGDRNENFYDLKNAGLIK